MTPKLGRGVDGGSDQPRTKIRHKIETPNASRYTTNGR
jgi:hypothetical protein